MLEVFGAREEHHTMPMSRALGPPPMSSSTHPRSSLSTWNVVVKPSLYRALAVFCMALSAMVIWCEGTILLDGAPFDFNLSPLSHIFHLLGTSKCHRTYP